MRAPVARSEARPRANGLSEEGDEAAARAIQDELAQFNIKRPILIYQPTYAMVARELDSGSEFAFPFAPPPAIGGEPSGGIVGGPGTGPAAPSGGNPGGLQSSPRANITSTLAIAQWSTTKRVSGNFDDMWADVSFRIKPDGKVADVKIIRSKGDLHWTRPLLISLGGRRYTAGKAQRCSFAPDGTLYLHVGL